MPARAGSATPAVRAEGPAAKRQRTVSASVAEPQTVGRVTRSAAKTPGSALPRSTARPGTAPRSAAKAAPRSTTKTRAGGASAAGSATRGVLTTTQARIASGSALGPKTPGAPMAAAARRPKRESFKPRPSMEAAVFAPAIDVRGAPRWPGIKEEAED
jgi:hypothetical protein